MVMGTVPLLVLMAFAPMEMQGLGTGAFDPFLSTADVPRLLTGSWMVSLNILIPDSKFLPWSKCCWLGLVDSRPSSSRLP